MSIERHVTPAEVEESLGCSRSAAYAHLRRAAGRVSGARGLLRVPVSVWLVYVEELRRCGSTDAQGRRSGSATTSTRPRAAPAVAARSARTEAAATAVGIGFERAAAGAPDSNAMFVYGAPSSFIYFVQAGDGGPIKVGRSKSPGFRVDRLQTAAHEELKLLAVMPGGASLERVIHRGLRFSHVRGEWYEATPLLMGLVKEFGQRG